MKENIITAIGCDANEWVGFRSLRKYQLALSLSEVIDISIQGSLYKVVNATSDYNYNYLQLISIESGKIFCLKSSGLGSGFSLLGGCIYPFESPELNKYKLIWSDPSNKDVMIRLGNKNFAHFIWNELDALLELISVSKINYSFYQDFNSIFDVSKLSPRLIKCSALDLKACKTFHLGSRIVTNRVRSLVKAGFKSSSVSVPMSPGQGMTFLIGVRGPGKRELINEIDFYSALIYKLSRKYRASRFIFDGITLPVDSCSHPSFALKVRAENVKKRIDSLISIADVAPSRFLIANNSSFQELFSLVSFTDYYITHEGTMQHKIGWLSPSTKGLILTASPNAKSVAKWHEEQVDEPSIVDYLPQVCISKIGDGKNRNTSFLIPDVSEAVNLILQSIEARLGSG